MKRFLIAMALVALMVGTVSAEGMMFGIKGGLNMANVSGDDVEDNAMKMAFGGGVWLNYAINEAFSVQPELMYMLKGADNADADSMTFNLSYIDINLLAKYTIPMEGKFAPYIFGGPYISMLMSAESEVVSKTTDIKDDMKSMDYGAMIGAGFDYMLEQGCISFDARYALGLASIVDETDSDVKNTGIMVMVGYGFAF